MIKVTGLFIYPVKSLGGIALSEADLGPRGFKYDREWMIVDSDNRFLTQREIARMALIETSIDEDAGRLTLRLPGSAQVLAVPLEPVAYDSTSKEDKAKTVMVSVWSDRARATVESDEINSALSDYLGQAVKLVRMVHGYRRQVDGRYAPGKENIVGFADGFPLLIISEESLKDLNERLEYPILMNRFRPNITTSGGKPFAEDQWNKIKIGEIELALVKPCARCTITTIDQECAEAGKEPLRTLANYRKQNGKIMFGQNAIFRGSGSIQVGAPVQVL
ncbi:MAG: MOSC domain-containing protein [Cyanobacteria bacterium SZAS LIN-3]|nr:MOSC domain-containing protein [Cyanobacteria bacterium SZAS LIN-3]